VYCQFFYEFTRMGEIETFNLLQIVANVL